MAPTDLDVTGWDLRLEHALAGRGVSSVYQPIVDLRRGAVVGYEALARFDHPSGQVTPEAWFTAAEERGVVTELDLVALRSALSRRAELPPNCFLTVNVEPETLLLPSIRTELARLGDLDGLVIEITEHRPIALAALAPVCEWLQAAGALLAVDDAGSGYAGLQAILGLRPALLKLDRSLITGIDKDEARAALAEMVGLFASRIDAWVLAEGVETEAEALRLVDLGVPLGQGYFFGRPAPPWAPIDPSAALAVVDRSGLSGATLRPLLQRSPSIRRGQAVGDLFATEEPWVVVIDEHDRPVGLLTPASALDGDLLRSLRVRIDSTPADVAHRLSTADVDPSLPALVTDGAGRYLGVVPLRRLLSHLAGGDD